VTAAVCDCMPTTAPVCVVYNTVTSAGYTRDYCAKLADALVWDLRLTLCTACSCFPHSRLQALLQRTL
jgi:hypothetical protein